MSWQATKWSMGLGLPLTVGAVLKSLAYHADKHGMDARPGMKTICYESGLAERAVQRSLRLLEFNNLIERQTDGKGGRRLRTDYRLLMEENPAYDDKGNPVPKTPFLTTLPEKPRILGQETPHMGTVNPASQDNPIRKGTVIEPSIEPVKTTTAPRWLEILSEDPRWPTELADQFVEDVEVAFSTAVNLTIEAQKCLRWLQNTPKGKKGKDLPRTWLNWCGKGLKDQLKTPRPPGETNGRTPRKSRNDPDRYRVAAEREAAARRGGVP